MAISKPFEVHRSAVRNIIHKWKIFKTGANLTRSVNKLTTKSDRAMLSETQELHLKLYRLQSSC